MADYYDDYYGDYDPEDMAAANPLRSMVEYLTSKPFFDSSDIDEVQFRRSLKRAILLKVLLG